MDDGRWTMNDGHGPLSSTSSYHMDTSPPSHSNSPTTPSPSASSPSTFRLTAMRPTTSVMMLTLAFFVALLLSPCSAAIPVISRLLGRQSSALDATSPLAPPAVVNLTASAFWAGIMPDAKRVHDGTLWLHPTTDLLPNRSRIVHSSLNGTVLRTYSFSYPNLWFTIDLFITPTTLHILLQNTSTVSLIGLSRSTGQQTSALTLPSRTYWAGVDRNGTVLLIPSPTSSSVQLLDAHTGQLLSTLNGNSRLQVRTATLHPGGGPGVRGERDGGE